MVHAACMRTLTLIIIITTTTTTIIIITRCMGARPTVLQLNTSLHDRVPPSPSILAQREPHTHCSPPGAHIVRANTSVRMYTRAHLHEHMRTHRWTGWRGFEAEGSAVVHAACVRTLTLIIIITTTTIITTISIIIITRRMGARPTVPQLDTSLHDCVPPSPSILAQREPHTHCSPPGAHIVRANTSVRMYTRAHLHEHMRTHRWTGWRGFEAEGSAVVHAACVRTLTLIIIITTTTIITTISIIIITRRMGARPTVPQLDTSLHDCVPPNPSILAQREPHTHYSPPGSHTTHRTVVSMAWPGR